MEEVCRQLEKDISEMSETEWKAALYILLGKYRKEKCDPFIADESKNADAIEIARLTRQKASDIDFGLMKGEFYYGSLQGKQVLHNHEF